MIPHYAKQCKLSLMFLFFASAWSSQVIAPFSSIYQTSQKGGIVFLSNAALGCSSNPPAATGTCATGSQETPLLGTTRNDDFLSSYIDIDGDPTTFMSSSDRLDLPACSRITKAILFWGASGTATTGFNQVQLKLNTGAYQAVTATGTLANTTGYISYHCYADVTNLISSAGIADRVTVANIPSSLVGQLNTFGSWNLVIVYQNDNMTMRQLTVFNGLANLSTLTPSINIPLSGFQTPATGSVGLEVGVYSHDGDRAMTGDNVLFNGNLTFLPLTDLLTNPAADVMNSTVSNNGVVNAFRNPLLLNTMGSDADIYVPNNLLSLYLANAATTATVMLVAGTDNYLTQALTTSIDSYDPDLRAAMRARDVNGGTLNAGDIVEYKIRGYNLGNDNSVGTTITTTLNPGVNYIANSTSIAFGPNAGAKTDAPGDDQVDYNPATRVIRIRIGTGANATLGGTLLGSSTGVDSTVVSYSVAVSQSCLKLSCFNNTITASAVISGTGSIFTAQTFTAASTPGTNDTFGCPVQGATTSTVSSATCFAPTLSSSTPPCTGGTLSLFINDPEASFVFSGPNSFTSAVRNPTLAPLTNGLGGVYTVTLSIPNTTCSAVASTTVTPVTCTPVAVNDFTNTLVNTPVNGNAASNDINAIPGGTFSIANQSPNGVVTINASTGQYTFTPANNFTGVTTATYQLCNSLPVICVTAGITFTVYPSLVANPDLINTTPSVSAFGNLMANDNGTVAGGSYSITFTQLSTSTGTLTVNPATGQYTFAPNPTFVGSALTAYTICNISINPTQCSTTNISIQVRPNPFPLNDNISTVINTTVSGNAGANDTGTVGATFGIVNQPANGTIAINSTSGVYTYTPPANFTGVTSATYNLCNGAPNSCSTAVISITVYPNIVANPDVINTTPGTTVTGTLLTNDLGIIAGGSYSVSITQLNVLTGTLTIISSTGQYTFAPNPLFTGSAQTTYTVCNTGVNPQQCNTTTISINVSNLPVAVNDATATLVNTAVSGNAGANDSGTFGATFTFGALTASTGVISGNPLTGQYIYTPANNFTGTTSVTYTLCNLSSPPCSTATITFTVYPMLTANPDMIATTPSTTANGNLLTNDTGIVAGANYSVSVTSLPASTGTLTIDPSTGNYTFIPGSSFTGTAQTSYTVCNTSINPQQCSSASISISIGDLPVAVNDATLTLMGVAVSGNVGLNDLNTSGATFSFNGPSPVTGALTGNPATGDYTFTPFSGFSGVTYASYSLCLPNAVSCATALITFTVYPTIEAKPDLITTTLNNSVSGNLTQNDVGIYQGGTYSISLTQPAASIGAITLNASTGHYTFTPAFNYTGTSTSSYTLTQFNGTTTLQSSVTTITITVNEGGSPIGIAKSVSHVAYNTNGTFFLTYKVVVKNYSAQQVTNVAVSDDLSFTFPSPATYTVVDQPTTGNAAGSQLTLSNAYLGTSGYSLITSAGASSLAPGRADTIFFRVEVDPHNAQVIYNNSALASGVHFGLSVTDSSANGINPDPDGDGDPGNNNMPTPFNINLVKIGIAKYTGRSSSISNGCYLADFKFTVKNYGASTIYNIQVFDDLDRTFGASNYTVTSAPSSVNGYLSPDNTYNGSANTNLVLYNSHLDAGQTDTLLLHVKYCTGSHQSLSNSATAYGNSLPGGGFIGYDISTSGLDPDPDHNNNPSEDSATVFMPAEDFQIPQGFSPNGDSYNDYFEIKGIDKYPDLEVSILNRWGGMVYNKKKYDNSWNGNSNEGLDFSGNTLPEGTYYYIVDLGTGEKPIKGFVYLKR